MRRLVGRHIFLLLLLITVTYVGKTESAKILGLFLTPSYSHQQPLLALSYALGARGHELTILTTNPSKEDMINVRQVNFNSLYQDLHRLQAMAGQMNLQKRKSTFELLRELCGFYDAMAHEITLKPQLINIVRELNGTKFDLILYEPLSFTFLLGFGHIVGNPPVVGISPTNSWDDPIGNAMVPSYVPQCMVPYTDHMSLFQRFYNLMIEISMKYSVETCNLPVQDKYVKRVFGDIPYTAKQMEYNKSLMIVCSDWTMVYPKPTLPNTIYVGPLHIRKGDPLSEDLIQWMDEAEDGVIYFSLGSNMMGTSVPTPTRKMFIDAFKLFPSYRILWKWEGDQDLSGKPDNVRTYKWIPQQTVFAHPKVKLFISQVGIQSLGEAISYKIPILCIPMFGDQDFNSVKIVKEGGGRLLEFSLLTLDVIHSNIKILLTDPSYKENMIRLANITNDTPIPAMDTAIWWVEYVIRHKGAAHLRPASLDLSWYEIHLLDIFGLVVMTFIIVWKVVVCIICCLVKRCKRRKIETPVAQQEVQSEPSTSVRERRSPTPESPAAPPPTPTDSSTRNPSLLRGRASESREPGLVQRRIPERAAASATRSRRPIASSSQQDSPTMGTRSQHRSQRNLRRR